MGDVLSVVVQSSTVGIAVSQDAVEVFPCPRQNLASLAHLRLAAGLHHLREGGRDLAYQPAQLVRLVGDVAAHLLPRRRLVFAALIYVLAPCLGQLEQLAPVDLLGADQPLVLELCQRRIRRARARAPDAVAALLHLLHDLVAVARLLGQQQQRGGADIPAACLTPAAKRTAAGRKSAAARAMPGEAEVFSVSMSYAMHANSYR